MIDKKQFFNYCTKAGCAWLKCYCTRQQGYNKFYSTRLDHNSIMRLYLYRDAPDIPAREKQKEFSILYGPLGIKKSDFGKAGHVTMKKVLGIVKGNSKAIFASNDWWSVVNDFYCHPKIDLVKNPIVLREFDRGKLEIIDGNHRIIAKLLKEGFTFKCNALVTAKA